MVTSNETISGSAAGERGNANSRVGFDESAPDWGDGSGKRTPGEYIVSEYGTSDNGRRAARPRRRVATSHGRLRTFTGATIASGTWKLSSVPVMSGRGSRCPSRFV
jgi:hypothetical protein